VKVRTSKVLKDFGQWVVTTYGVECTENYYPIEKRRLWENEGSHPWEQHMAEKIWVHNVAFARAMAWARERFAESKTS
jgi:hypothetical protein